MWSWASVMREISTWCIHCHWYPTIGCRHCTLFAAACWSMSPMLLGGGCVTSLTWPRLRKEPSNSLLATHPCRMRGLYSSLICRSEEASHPLLVCSGHAQRE
ncbi:hypothetical protein KP509_04G035400 [Ceratopteris richardii]|uniref:Uncharacterized protein n=1 Tax=Ceratopteris richardii TaxID=49495 RepID=A0A8T2UUD8_CERRI|nr:hypothetical protein KP509_04G035400 [Ceratopteris richardii]